MGGSAQSGDKVSPEVHDVWKKAMNHFKSTTNKGLYTLNGIRQEVTPYLPDHKYITSDISPLISRSLTIHPYFLFLPFFLPFFLPSFLPSFLHFPHTHSQFTSPPLPSFRSFSGVFLPYHQRQSHQRPSSVLPGARSVRRQQTHPRC